MPRKPNKLSSYICKCGETFTLLKKTAGVPRCKKCLLVEALDRAKSKKYHLKPRYKEQRHHWPLKNLYGLDPLDYNHLFEQQGGVCAICKKPETRSRLCLDHDHTSGTIRGLLCHKCNLSIGILSDDIGLFRSCLSYLMKFDKRKGWDDYFLDICELVSTRSKDPSTKVGAVIVKDKIILSTGYNGFPRGVNDNISSRYDRPEKYLWTIHAEENAILNACRMGIKTDGATLYVLPMSPCSKCALAIVQAGIKEVVVRKTVENPRFEESITKATEIFNSSKILVRTPE